MSAPNILSSDAMGNEQALANAEFAREAYNHHDELLTRLYNLVNEAKTVMLDLGTFVATDDVPTSVLNQRVKEAEATLSKLIDERTK